MIRLAIGCVIAALACLAGVPASAQSPVVCYPGSGSVSQSPFCQPINPMAIGAAFTQSARAADLVATSSSSRVILGLSSTVTAQTARVCNTSSTIAAYVALGDVTVTVTTANGLLVSAGGCVSLNIGSNTYLAGITGSSSATLVTSLGYGVAALGGGGGGAASGGGTPGGSDTQVQYNNAGSFGGISSWTTNGTTNFIGATNSVLSAGSAGGAAAILGGTPTAIATYSAGTATPRIQSQGLTASNAGGAFSMWANSTGGPAIWMTSSRGTTVGDYTIAQAGDSMGSIIWEGADGTDFARAAQIVGRVTGTPGANVMPGQLEFLTSPVGTSTPVLALTLNSDQTALFAGAVTASAFIPSGSTIPSRGMYAGGTGELYFSTNTTLRWQISNGGTFASNNAAGPGLLNVAASSTVPTYNPNRANTGDGIGSAGAGFVNLISASTTRVQIGTGAASVSDVLLPGTLFTGGTATTTFPQILVQPTGTAAVTTWSTSGTILGANVVSGFAGNFLDFHIAGAASVFSVSSAGSVLAGANVKLGGTTNSFPALTFSGTELRVRLADDSAYAPLNASRLGLSNNAFLVDEGAAIIAQRTGLVAQTFRVYNTYTDASNYERGVFDWSTTANTLTVGTASAGTGSARSMNLIAAGSVAASFGGSNIDLGARNLRWTTDNAFDIGASGANRPRNVFVAGTGTFGAPVKISSGYTVGTLPTGTVGQFAYVTDQLTTCAVAGAALTGGGAVTCPVFYNGSAWVGG